MTMRFAAEAEMDEQANMKQPKNFLWTLLRGTAGVWRVLRKNAVDMARIQGAMVYLKGVEIVRDLLVYQLGLLACVIFLVFGVMMMQAAVIFLLPPGQIRVFTALGIGALDFFVSLGLLGYFVSSSRWLREAAKYNDQVRDVLEETEKHS